MVVYTDSVHYAEQVLPPTMAGWSSPSASLDGDLRRLSEALFQDKRIRQTRTEPISPWTHCFITESARGSQYDLLIELSREKSSLPDGIVCLAGAGRDFHGFKGRAWKALAGNVHLSVHLAPGKPIDHFGVGFTLLAAVSVVDAIDRIPGLEGRAGLKWVNDILIDEAKVCGVLAYTQTMTDTVMGAVLGIGLNVETKPRVEPTPFVPKVSCLKDFAPHPDACNQRAVVKELLHSLGRNYHTLLDGGYNRLLGRYRERCLVLGREVIVCSDDSGEQLEVIAEGRVGGLGDHMELLVEGREQPVSKGRLILKG